MNVLPGWRGVYPAICTPFTPDDEVDVEAAEALDRLLDERTHRVLVADVAGDERRPGTRRLELGRDLPALSGRALREDDGGALGGEPARDRAPDPTPGARHERDAALEPAAGTLVCMERLGAHSSS